MKNLSNNLRQIRKERDKTVKEVVDGTGIPMRTYQNYEYQEREISAGALLKLADFYGVSTDYLLGRPGALPPADPLAKLELSAMELYMLRSYLALDPDKRRNFFDGVVMSVNRDSSAQETDDSQQDAEAQTLSMAARGGDDHSGKQAIPGGINTLLDSPSTDDDL